MAIAIQIPGLCNVSVNTGTSAALEQLGYTIDGVEIEEQVKLLEVFGDQNGGEEGNPIDWQHLGLVDVITLNFTKFDATVAQKCGQRLNPGTSTYGGTIAAGVSPLPGTLLLGTASTYRLLLNPAAGAPFIRNYLLAIPIDPIGHNTGTKHQKRLQRWFAFPPVAGGVLWNTTTS